MKSYKFTISGESFTARIVEHTEAKIVVDLNGTTYDVDLVPEESPVAASAVGVSVPKPAVRTSAPLVPATPSVSAAAVTSGAVTAPIPGVVKQISVAPGDKVEEGSVVLILEAMKMENQIPAPFGGTVSKIAVNLGDSVLDGQVLIQIEA